MFLLSLNIHAQATRAQLLVFTAEIRFPNTGCTYNAQCSPNPVTGTHWYSLVSASPTIAGRLCPGSQLVISSPCHGETSTGIQEETPSTSNGSPLEESPSYASLPHLLINISPPQQKVSSAFSLCPFPFSDF